MKKIKKLFFSLILFLFYANITNATTKGTYVVSEKNTGKELLVFIGIVLIALIIFLGYTLDKKDEIKKKREKYNKTNNKTNNQTKAELEPEEDIQVEEKTATKVTDDTVMINYAKLRELEKETIENNEENYYKPNFEEENPLKEKYVTVEDIIDNNEIDSTMIINSVENVKVNIPDEIKEIEEYEQQEEAEINEDLELLELEKAIKDAGIKRYTRKKKKIKKNVKRYTRKKVKIESEPIVETRRRGRPPKVKTEEVVKVPKRGRGRPRKTETSVIVKTTTRKRGRPAKSKTEKNVEVPKRGRGRPRKN